MKKTKAFTLVEVIIATAITAVIATSIFILFTRSTVWNNDTKERQVATRVGQSRIEKLRSMSFADMINSSENITISDLPNGHRITTIKDTYTSTDIKEAQVQVTWTSENGTESVKFNTLIYNQED